MKQARTVHLLNAGYIKLVDWMGDDLTPVRSARTSYDRADKTGENKANDLSLLRSLIRRGHTSPFEAITMTFEVKAPIFVFRQWHRHRTQSFNEMSARYTQLPDEWYVPELHLIGEQDAYERQARVINNDEIGFATNADKQREASRDAYEEVCRRIYREYEDLLESGWPRELARCILPVAMYSKMVATMNMLNAIRFLRLRTEAHAQYEIRGYAEGMALLLEAEFPETMAAFREVNYSLEGE